MAKTTPNDKTLDLTPEQELAATKEALRMQELDAVEREERISTLEAQAAKNAVNAVNSTNLPTIEHDGEQYRFKYAALFVGKERLTADQIAEDDELVAKLIASGSAAIEKV